jgi:flagellar protein FlaG
MEIAISSPMRLKSPELVGQTYRSKREVKRNADISNLPLIRETSAFLRSEIKVAISSLNKNKIDYKLNLETNELVIQVLDSESGEVIRQIPGEDFLRLTSRITDFNQKILNESI